MKVGVFTALLSQLPLDEVLKKLNGISDRYRGTRHRKLSGRCSLQTVDAGEQFCARGVQEQAG